MTPNPVRIRIIRPIPTVGLSMEIVDALVGCELVVRDDAPSPSCFRNFDGTHPSHMGEAADRFYVRSDDMEAWLNVNADSSVADAFKRVIDGLTEEGFVSLPVFVSLPQSACARL